MGKAKMYTKAIKILSKALEVFTIGDNSHILYALAKYNLMIGRIMDSLNYINYLVERRWNDVEILMIKSYILSLNRKTQNESEIIWLRCQQYWKIEYDEVPLIKEFKSTFKHPNLVQEPEFGTFVDQNKWVSDLSGKPTFEFTYEIKTLKNLIIKDLSLFLDKMTSKIE